MAALCDVCLPRRIRGCSLNTSISRPDTSSAASSKTLVPAPLEGDAKVRVDEAVYAAKGESEFRSGDHGCFDIGVPEWSRRQVSAIAYPDGSGVSGHAGHAYARKGDPRSRMPTPAETPVATGPAAIWDRILPNIRGVSAFARVRHVAAGFKMALFGKKEFFARSQTS
jgi:hypothetical protein